jgi:hypothetical protein
MSGIVIIARQNRRKLSRFNYGEICQEMKDLKGNERLFMAVRVDYWPNGRYRDAVWPVAQGQSIFGMPTFNCEIFLAGNSARSTSAAWVKLPSGIRFL